MDYRNVNVFSRELNLIMDEDLRMIVKTFLDERTPDYFWTDGASSSGKFHPDFAHGIGGLVRHTKAVVMFAEELLRMSSYSYMTDACKDYTIVACILHDTFKYGFDNEIQKEEYKEHARNAGNAFKAYCEECGYAVSPFLIEAMFAHMGQWSTHKEDRPFTPIDRCVHLADYMASRAFIDIPTITAEYDAVMGIGNITLPF